MNSTQFHEYQTHDLGDDYWGNHPNCTVEDWRDEVSEDATRLGYWDWVIEQLGESKPGRTLFHLEQIFKLRPERLDQVKTLFNQETISTLAKEVEWSYRALGTHKVAMTFGNFQSMLTAQTRFKAIVDYLGGQIL